MTFSTQISRIVSNGDGVTVLYPFPYLFYLNSHIIVGVDGAVQTEGIHYNITGAGNPAGGNITFTVGSEPPIGISNVVIERILPLIQTEDPQNFDGNPADSVEIVYDKMIMMNQQLQDQMGRALILPNTSLLTSVSVPNPVAGKALLWNATADGLENSVDDFNNIVADATAQAVLAAASAVAAAADATLTAADVVQTGTDVIQTGVDAAAAAASAASAAAAVAQGLYQQVISKAFADSPYIPPLLEEGALYRIDTSGGNVIINLTDVATYAEDMKFAFVKVTGDANTVTINVNAADTIDGVLGGSLVISNINSVVNFIGQNSTNSWNSVSSGGIATPSATENVAGKAEIATQAETDAGIDDSRFVTPLKFASSSLLTSSGFTTLIELSGAGNFIVPAGVTLIKTTLVGGGGGGSSDSPSGSGGAGGVGGNTNFDTLTALGGHSGNGTIGNVVNSLYKIESNNGGQGSDGDSRHGDAGGGEIIIAYLTVTPAASLAYSIGAGAIGGPIPAGGTKVGANGFAGTIILEY